MKLNEFRRHAEEALKLDLSSRSPHAALLAEEARNLFIPAAAGSGKTSALALLALKAMFVDGFGADAIVATTFTRKAALELRSRVTAGVMRMAERTDRRIDERALDVAAMRIGTLDDLANQALVELQLGALVDGIVQRGLMRNAVFAATAGFRASAPQRGLIAAELSELFGGTVQQWVTAFRDRALTLNDRFGHDRINRAKYAARGPGAAATLAIVDRYREALTERAQMDFVVLEERFLQELEGGGLQGWLDPTRVLLVDEYQDTNLLQETIYRRIVDYLLPPGGWYALVGDDEQSLYRFRGATVELFVTAQRRFPGQAETVPLSVNRRSSLPVLALANAYVGLDRRYQSARATGKVPLAGAPEREPWSMSDGIPILGLFRPDVATLAQDLAAAMSDMLGSGWKVHGGPVGVEQAGDIAVLAPTTQAVTESFGKTNRRVFGELADACQARGIRWFNPRGTRLADAEPVQELLGLALMCLDPREQFLPSFVLNQASNHFAEWRAAGTRLIRRNPPPAEPHTLADFVRAWQKRKPQGRRAGEWPRTFPVMELLHELTVWIPHLRESPGFLYLEGLTRALDQLATLIGPWAIMISRDRWDRSVESLYKEFFIPIALNEFELDEEVLEVLPLDAVNAITIHQAKGLEFPVCFVDVCSRFATNHHTQRFARFPDGPLGDPYTLEDQLRPLSKGLKKPRRSATDRAFDDLIRTFYVAFTRAQHVLVLFGLGSRDDGPNPIPNVATGWTRDGRDRFSDLGITLV